ncbi:hypothetical protein HCA84_02510 [Listeria booriae]|uniref:hypothetical protein n=1 Tax=Listeria booriae TaxID=1552123 RepID=UPI0016243418|nr:hypothetical protein [Listeria booriae]MBC1974536.1 hypothetical protein [Listeria booriae]MBC2031828.1 hypothetical protein [Listeria booriae]
MKWRVRVNNMYFLRWEDGGLAPVFMINDSLGKLKEASVFGDYHMAKHVAGHVGGVVERVEECEG